MIRDLKATFEIKKYNEIFYGIIVFGAVLLSLIITACTEDDLTIIELCASFIAGGYIGMSIFFKPFLVATDFPRALSFGMTRKKMFIYTRLYDLVEIIIISLIIIALPSVVGASVVLKVAAICFGLFSLISGAVGNSIIRFGKNAYWVYYVGIFVLMFGVPRLSHIVPAIRDCFASAFDHLVNPVYNQLGIWLGIIVFIVVTLIINWLTTRRVAVNNDL